MRLFNGMAKFYRIEGRTRAYKNAQWGDFVGNHNGHPKGFTASDPVWQKYGVFGAETFEITKKALRLCIENFPEYDFRIVKTMVMISNTVIGPEHYSDSPNTPPTTSSYPNNEHYEHLFRVAAVCEFEPADHIVAGSRKWRKLQKEKTD